MNMDAKEAEAPLPPIICKGEPPIFVTTKHYCVNRAITLSLALMHTHIVCIYEPQIKPTCGGRHERAVGMSQVIQGTQYISEILFSFLGLSNHRSGYMTCGFGSLAPHSLPQGDTGLYITLCCSDEYM